MTAESRRWLPRRRNRDDRKGIAIVELALCLPLIVFLVLATLDATTMIFLNHSLTISAYEGARVAVAPDGTDSDALAGANAVLTNRNVNGGSVTISPTNVDSLDPGTQITITVNAPAESNTLIPTLFYSGKTISSTCTMVKE